MKPVLTPKEANDLMRDAGDEMSGNKKRRPGAAHRGGGKNARGNKTRNAIIAGSRAVCNLLCAGGIGVAFGLTLCAAALEDGEVLALAAVIFAAAAFVGIAGEVVVDEVQRK